MVAGGQVGDTGATVVLALDHQVFLVDEHRSWELALSAVANMMTDRPSRRVCALEVTDVSEIRAPEDDLDHLSSDPFRVADNSGCHDDAVRPRESVTNDLNSA